MKRSAFLIAFPFLFLVASCSPERVAEIEEVEPQPGYRIIPARWGELALAQCSRVSPPFDGPFWSDSSGDVAAFEQRLEQALSDPPADLVKSEKQDRANGVAIPQPTDFVSSREKLGREYIGYTVNGRRMIYGNFYPPFEAADFASVPAEDRDGPYGTCDGGHVFFGAEYDVEKRLIDRISFDGAIEVGGIYVQPFRPASE